MGSRRNNTARNTTIYRGARRGSSAPSFFIPSACTRRQEELQGDTSPSPAGEV